jgi:hypothetical protein
MTTLPPPIPGMPKNVANMQPPPIGGQPGQSKAKTIHPEDYVKASSLPLIVAIAASIASVFTIIFGDLSTWVHVAGYFLTPFLVIICAGLDSVQQRRKATTDLYFIENRKFSLLLRVLSGISLLLSIPHINSIATTVSAWVAKI